MPAATCFDSRMLQDYLLGKLSDEQSDAIAVHLEACLTCEATISQLDRASDTLTDGLRLPTEAASPAEEPHVSDAVLRQALERVQLLGTSLAAGPEVSRREVPAQPLPSRLDTNRLPMLRDYRLLEAIGSGGMGQVFKAVHTRLDRLVAVKLLPARRLGDEQAVARFQREMRAIGQLSHPAIVQATDAGEVEGTHFLVMEYVEGFDLNMIAKACGPLSTADACEIARQAALGLEYAHQQGIVHRDIKPSNLMLSFVVPPLGGSMNVGQRTQPPEAGTTNVKILDLGLALLSGVQAPVDELTTVGQLMGTLDYMAPEQLEDSHQVGPAADIYALAATLFRLLTGVAPFAKDDRKTPLQKLRALATQSAPPIRERRPDLPEDLAAIVDRALSRDPAERFTAMSEFAEQLAPWCAGHDLAALSKRASILAQHSPAVESSHGLIRLAGGVSPPVSRESVVIPPTGGLTPPASQVVEAASPRRRRSWLVALVALVGFITLGVVITIETNKGTLIVESVREVVEVRVKRSGKVVENLEITTGSKSTRLAAGEYEIEIVGQTDGLSIQNGKFVLKRGDLVIAKVVEIPKDQAFAQHAHETEPETPQREPAKPVPVEIVDREAKGMEAFELANPDWAAEKKVREVLRTRIEFDFVDTPLTDCIAYLENYLSTATKSDFRILFNTDALKEENISRDTPVTLNLTNIGASDVLEIMLRRLNCVWLIDNGQVLITTKSKEHEALVTRTYPVGKLMPGVQQAVTRMAAERAKTFGSGGRFFDGRFFRDFAPWSPIPSPTESDHLSNLPEMLGHPWQRTSGMGGSVNLLGNMLVVRHSRKAHADVESLLRTVEAAFLKPLTEPAEIRPQDYPLEADAYVRKQLARVTEIDFADTPLNDVAGYFADRLQVQILIDTERLAEAGIATDAPVTLTLANVTGEVVLLRTLKPLQLTTRVDRGVLVITTIAAEQTHLVTKVYDVRNLLASGLTPAGLMTSLQVSGTSGPWQDQGGGGGQAMIFADTLLVMRQSVTNHHEAAKFLDSLNSQMRDHQEVPRVLKPQTESTGPANLVARDRNQPQRGGPATAPTKPATDNQPLYDGNTFDEWLAVFDTERSPARLADAIEALRLLGRDTHAELIAERVLKASRVSDFSVDPAGNNRGSAYNELSKLFENLPAAVVHRACAKELKNGNARSRKFLLENTYFLRISSPMAEELPAAMLDVCRDSDDLIRLIAVQTVKLLPVEASNTKLIELRTARLREALKDKLDEIAISAAEQLREVESESKAVAETLARILAKPDHDTYQRIIAINQLAVMGPRAVSVAPEVAAVLLEPLSDEENFVSAEVGWLAPFRSAQRNTFQFVAAVALARMGREAATELPTIQKALDNPDAMKGYEDREGAVVRRTVQWPDLLMAVKSRLSEPVTLDIRGGDSKAIESANRVIERSYQLLKMEAALLQQYRPKDPAIKPLLDRCETIKHDAELVIALRTVRQSVERPMETPAEIATFLVRTMQQQHKGRSLWRDERPSETSTGTRILADSPRESAINELGKLGPAAREALPLLKKELESTNKAVAAAAENAIKLIEAEPDNKKAE